MEQIPLNSFEQDLETLISDSSDWMVCDPSSRLIPTGFRRSESSEEYVLFVNSGGEAINEADGGLTVLADSFFEGGNVLRTDEQIAEAGDCPLIYQSARLGNFCYRFDKLPRGDYIVDLHFVEIINTNGPKGIRMFNVYIQEEKVLSELDIFAVVGANKPLQLVDSRGSVKDDGVILIRFESIDGSPVVSGICIRRATKESGTTGATSLPSFDDDTEDPGHKWLKSIKIKTSTDPQTKLDRYIVTDSRYEISFASKFDILLWWKVNSQKYKILSHKTRDILAISAFTVVSESAFSTGRRIVDHYKSYLSYKMIEALIYSQNWLQASQSINDLAYKLQEFDNFDEMKNAIQLADAILRRENMMTTGD